MAWDKPHHWWSALYPGARRILFSPIQGALVKDKSFVPSIREDDGPGFYFFVQDWLQEETLKTCGFAEKGLWIDMLCLMARSPRKGILLKPNGMPADGKWLADQLGKTEEAIKPLLDKLGMELVYSVTPDTGAIYSRKMKAAADLSETRSAVGKKGAASRWNPDGKGMANQNGNGMANTGKDGVGKEWLDVVVPESLSVPEFVKAWQEWIEFRREDKRKPVTARAAQKQLKMLVECGPKVAVEIIERSIANQWQGLFPPEPTGRGRERRQGGKPDGHGPYKPSLDVSPEALERQARAED